jgi:hypothetical protein
VSVTLVNIDKESWFKISDSDKFRPFFMNVVSDSNHWMFISSNGGLTAGRKNSEFALFPYYTDDKLTDLAHTTGSKTIFQIRQNAETHIWEPFSDRYVDRYSISRNIYKSMYGNKVMFEEIIHDFNLVYRYQWNTSNLFGFVKKAELINQSNKAFDVVVLDGFQNIMPYGISPDLQTSTSNLADAYKRSELVKPSGLGIFALSAIIVDKAEPSEALKANVVWASGLENPTYLLSTFQLNEFRKAQKLVEEVDIKAEKGAYLVQSKFTSSSNSTKNWQFVANVNQNHSQIIALDKRINEDLAQLNSDLENDIHKGTETLIQLVASADGLQSTADVLKDARHFSNVLFNIMRGGIFDQNYMIEKGDFVTYLGNASKSVVKKEAEFLESLPAILDLKELNNLLEKQNDPDLKRLSKEYLPLKFSRRHGDPSRPWNKFSINTNNEIDGSKILDYEGNWRDIFQNWEALVHSYPDFVEGMISKFLNATTFDGYNPYRVTKGGFDWETIEPDNPWSYIGYWGDHQIIYLLKFLEFYQSHKPKDFDALFASNYFVYAHVPYRIKSFDEIVKNPKDTIEFDHDADIEIRKRIEENGADGSLRLTQNNEIHRVNFIEKILATTLSKLSNFIPEAGIWMNTQRPEWNDANNALVGNGVSMVTLNYLRRFMFFFEEVLAQSELNEIEVSNEVVHLFTKIEQIFSNNTHLLAGSISNLDRKLITVSLGTAGSEFRDSIYEHGFSGSKTSISIKKIKEFSKLSLSFLEHTIRANKRKDDLYHSYNLLSIKNDGFVISYLSEMLEGQVAVISSGYLKAEEVVKVLHAMRNSALYREDQNSYMLYPNKNLPGFLQKNSILKEDILQSELVKKLLEANDYRIIQKNSEGGYHFNGNFKNASDLKQALLSLKSTKYASLVEKEEPLLLTIFEKVFNHKAFTGRSGTFFAYEGLGSIYWHMVSKLHLAVTEVCVKAAENHETEAVQKDLAHYFDEIGKGIGLHKTPELYGAFPTDPYSHTPSHRGAQQPGMTGQVKEDILVRFSELGLKVVNGNLQFSPSLLQQNEFIQKSKAFDFVNVNQQFDTVLQSPNSVSFTYCQVPVVYSIDKKEHIVVSFTSGETQEIDGLSLGTELSKSVFQRSGQVSKITVNAQIKEKS